MELKEMLDSRIICTQLERKTDQEVIFHLGQLMCQAGYVGASYPDSVWERELEYPTGIENEGFNFAITHADSEDIKKPGIAIAILKNPVGFHRIENPEETTQVRVVLMLSIVDPNSQVKILQQLMKRLQDDELFGTLYQCCGADEVIQAICNE